MAVAAAMKADECLIYTDVDGVYTTDPRIVAEARRLHTVSFEEMLEMASLGSKVLQIRSVEFAGKYRVKLRVLSSFTPWDIDINEEAKSGTLITFEEDEKMEQAVVSGIAFNRDEAKVTVMGVPDKPGIAYQILGAVADANIDVDVIIQNVSHDGKTDFSFTVHRNDYQRTMDLLKNKVQPATGAATVIGDQKICKVSIVGIGMRSHVGVASKMFRALSEEGINIQMISTSEIKTSVVIDEKYMELAVRALHKVFELDDPSARTASSMYFSSMTTEVLISLVLIIWMLMPSSDSARNILAAMPTWLRMPMPTMLTLQILVSPSMWSVPRLGSTLALSRSTVRA